MDAQKEEFMDDGDGKLISFEDEKELQELRSEYPLHGKCFAKGEEIKLRGSRFEITAIKPTMLHLKLLSR